jgi:predicted metal-dependent hydrolase
LSQVTSLAPAGKSVAEIEERLKRKAKWISRQLQFFEAYRPHPEPKRFVSGETHIYLGRQCRLKVRRSAEL